MTLSKQELAWAQRYWTSANYIAAASIYLKDNFLLERKLRPNDIKDALLGHWGTCPGINFVYTYLNLIATKHRQKTLLITGPGHGFAAILANAYLEGTLQKYYPQLTADKEGLGKTIQAFCWPEGFPSHTNPGVPGCIHEGGELGYALGTAFGAAFDNPDLLVAAIIGDGEAETGPTATAWHSTKFLNPARDGAVLPIVHLNSYKISSQTIYGSMSDAELKALFTGYGYEPRFVSTNHRQMGQTMEWAYQRILRIQAAARDGAPLQKPRWPVIILKTPKGWTGIKMLDGHPIEGTFRSHQVPAKDAKKNPASLRALEAWLKSYAPQKLFPKGIVPETTKIYLPPSELRISNNPHALGGNIRQPLILPNPKMYASVVSSSKRGNTFAGSTPTLGDYLAAVMKANLERRNFRIVSPDELSSNKLDAILDVTGRTWSWPILNADTKLSPDGRVMEMLSEHTLQAWLQGYILTGRHGLFPSYEAFLPIVDSMVSQYLKFIALSGEYSWRTPVSALNYVLTSVCWRQDHNGFSHQNPGFISTLISKAREEQLVRLYFPADANMSLAVMDHALRSMNRVNVIVADKQPIRQWQTYEEAIKQAQVGAGIWDFASTPNPEVVLAACGDYQTQEALATIHLLKSLLPEAKVRFVNVSELNVLGTPGEYPNALSPELFTEVFTPDKPVIFTFHGYPGTIKQLLFDRPNIHRFEIKGYTEHGTTTTPFDMLVRNNVSRYQLAIALLRHIAQTNPKNTKKATLAISMCEKKLIAHKNYIVKQGHDPEEINDWVWK